MKSKLISLIIGLGLCSVVGSVAAQSTHTALQSLNSIAAIVNKDVITESDLNLQVKLLRNELQQQNQKIPAEAVLRKKMLDQLIALKLQEQQAKKEGISISAAEVDQAIDNIAKQNRMTTAIFKQQVVKQGLSIKQYRQQIQDQLAITAAQRQAIKERVTVSDKEVAAAMRTIGKQAAGITRYHLLALSVPLPTVPTPAEIQSAQRKAAAVMKSLNQGEKFTDVAIALSAGGDGLQGGDMGWKQLTELPPLLTAKVAEASQDQVLGPFQMPNGVLILKVAGIKSSSGNQKVSSNQVRNMLLQQKYQQLVQTWVKQLKVDAFIKIMT